MIAATLGTIQHDMLWHTVVHVLLQEMSCKLYETYIVSIKNQNSMVWCFI